MLAHIGPETAQTTALYGFAVSGLDGASQLLNAASTGWETWRVTSEIGSDAEISTRRPHGFMLGAVEAHVPISLGVISVHRAAQRIDVLTRAAVPAADLVHPFLALPAAAIAHWNDDIPFHAGSYVDNSGRAWIVVGPRGTGKSTTMAALLEGGAPILCDDVAVLRGEEVLAGPRCIDLRGDAGARYQDAVPLGLVGTRERWRLPCPPVQRSYPLAGFVSLDWGDAISAKRLHQRATLPQIIAAQTLALRPRSPQRMLELASLPFFHVTRPRRIELLPQLVDLLRDLPDA
ncbi:MAG: hypothetical protein QM679_01255 [Patulibacter sp.]